jgi:hypothetical protein
MTEQMVDYELVVYDELPPRSGGAGGRSVLKEQLEKIIATPEWIGKPVQIGLYTKGTAATAAKNVLQQRHGRGPAVDGWKFETRRVPDREDPEAEMKMGLFAVYTPDAVVDGAKGAHELAEKRRKANLKEKREARAEENGSVDEEDEEDFEEELEDDEEELEEEDE